MLLLLFIYDKKSMKYYFKFELSNGWRLQWWKPYNFILNAFHLFKKRHKSIPAIRIKNRINKLLEPNKPKYTFKPSLEDDDLPF